MSAEATQASSCAACNARLAANTRFCAACGAPVTAAAGPAATAASPAPAPAASVADGSTGSWAVRAITHAGGVVQQQLSPFAASFRVPVKSLGGMYAFPVEYDGQLDLGNAASPSIALKITGKSLLLQVGSAIVAVIVVGFLPSSLLPTEGLAVGALAGLAGMLYGLLGYFPGKLRAKLLESIAQTAPQPGAVAASTIPSAKAGSPVPSPANESAGAAGSSIVDQLQRLADLKSMGAITDEEFAAKKAELLARI